MHLHRSIGAVSHGIIDYLMVIILGIGPSVAGFSGKQSWFCYLFAFLLLALTICTRFPLGIMKIVRLPLHGVIETLLAILMIVLPWIANFSRGVLSRNFFLAVGLLLAVISSMTDFRGLRGTASGTAPHP